MFGSRSCKKNSVFLCFLVFFSHIKNGSGEEEEVIPEHLMEKVYQSYKDALHIEEGTVSARRVFSNNKQYEIHVMKLNEVNGNKRHNLLIKESNDTNPLIYINNPLETKVSHSYLTYEEFKKVLTDRVKTLRQQFVATVNKAVTKTQKPKIKEKDKVVKEFKTFLDRLIKLQEDDVKANTTNVKKPVKSSSSKRPVFRIHTLKTDPEITNVTRPARLIKNTTIVTEIKESSVNHTNLLRSGKLNATEEIVFTTQTPTAATATESLVSKGEVTEVQLTKIEVTEAGETEFEITKITEQLPVEGEELNLEEMDSSTYSYTINTTPAETTTKRTTLGKPLVWMDGDENQRDVEI